MQNDNNYVKMKEDMQYAETAVLEVEAKLANLNDDMTRIME
jgi:hypothetical protein